MKKSGALLGLVCLAGCAVSQANAWWGRDDAYVNKSYTTTTIIVRPYNAFSDMSCNMIANGMVPLSLLSGCMNGGCNNGCRPACPPPPCGCGWPARYAPYGESAYYPSMYYPPVAYYPPPPPPPQHGHHGPPPQGYPPPPGYGPGPACPPPGYGGGY